ncbi:hypothetical protein [Priestia aryabhattai]
MENNLWKGVRKEVKRDFISRQKTGKQKNLQALIFDMKGLLDPELVIKQIDN